jgi:isopenicillin-N N-acyltransferase like protein
MTRRFTSTVDGPGERGLEFGTVHADQVRATVAAYFRLFALTRGPGSDIAEVVDHLGGLALARITGWAPELAAEISGIAQGAGVPVERIAAVNARTEILARLSTTAGDECSTVVSVGPAPVAMQNWDWYEAMAGNWLEWTIPHPDGRRVTTVTEYGMVGKIGVNERGVGTLLNILHHRNDGTGMGIPVHIVARRILDTAGDVADGLRACASASLLGLTASTAITVVDSSEAVSVELWPGGMGQVHPDSGRLLVRTNHFLTGPAREGDTWEERGSDTIARRAELSKRLGGRAGVDERAATAVLTDHGSGLCCHPNPADIPELGLATLATVSLDLAGRSLRVSDGSPCQARRESATASPTS